MEEVWSTKRPGIDEAAPDFEANTTHRPRQLSDYKGRWLILLSTVRATFFIDPAGVVRAMVDYPMTNGRSVDERIDWYFATKEL